MAITVHTDSAVHGRAMRPAPTQFRFAAVRSALALALAVGLTIGVLACLGTVIGRWS